MRADQHPVSFRLALDRRYKTYKTIAIDERLYSELKKLGSSQKSERAAKVIVRVLSTRFPCGKKK